MKPTQALFIFLLLCIAPGCGDGCGSSAKPDRQARWTRAPGARLYVSNEASGDVSVIDVASDKELRRIPVGKRPRSLRLSPDEKTLYVAVTGTPREGAGSTEGDRGADAIAVVELASGRVVRRLASGPDPEHIDVSSSGTQVYVVNRASEKVSVVDVASGSVVGSVGAPPAPEGIAAHPHGPVVYVPSTREDRVHVLDVSTYKPVSEAETGRRPRSVLVTPDGAHIFIANELGPSITVLEGEGGEVIATVPIEQPEARPMGLAISPDQKSLYVGNGQGQTVTEIDIKSLRVVRTMDARGSRPFGVAVSPDGTKLYTANGPSNDVSVIDLASGKVKQRIAVGGAPWGLVIASSVTDG